MKQFLSIYLLCFASVIYAQKLQIPNDTTVVTQHNTTVKDVSFSYTAETGTQPVWDDKGNPIASLFYTYYTRDNIKNRANRPLIFSFNATSDI